MPPVGVPEYLPTRLVRFRQWGHQALINVRDFDPALHEPIEAPVASPLATAVAVPLAALQRVTESLDAAVLPASPVGVARVPVVAVDLVERLPRPGCATCGSIVVDAAGRAVHVPGCGVAALAEKLSAPRARRRARRKKVKRAKAAASGAGVLDDDGYQAEPAPVTEADFDDDAEERQP